MSNRHNTIPSNYRRLPASRPRPAKDGEKGLHDHMMDGRLSGVLTLRIRAVDHIRIGSGGYSPFKNQLLAEVMVQKNKEGKDIPFIPGTSIKGVLRTVCEAIGNGAPPEDNGITSVTCSLFGEIKNGRNARHLMGRVGFSDALPYTDERTKAPQFGKVDLPRAFQPRKSVGRRIYDVPKELGDRVVPHWIIIRGAVFETQLQLQNVRPGELGLVLTAAGLSNNPNERFFPRLGGGKYAGLGRVEFSVVSARLREGYTKPRPTTLDGAELTQKVSQWLSAAEIASDGKAALRALRGGQ